MKQVLVIDYILEHKQDLFKDATFPIDMLDNLTIVDMCLPQWRRQHNTMSIEETAKDLVYFANQRTLPLLWEIRTGYFKYT